MYIHSTCPLHREIINFIFLERNMHWATQRQAASTMQGWDSQTAPWAHRALCKLTGALQAGCFTLSRETHLYADSDWIRMHFYQKSYINKANCTYSLFEHKLAHVFKNCFKLKEYILNLGSRNSCQNNWAHCGILCLVFFFFLLWIFQLETNFSFILPP